MLKLLNRCKKNLQKRSKVGKPETRHPKSKRSRDEDITQYIVHHIGTI